jgi:hypothetical protein
MSVELWLPVLARFEPAHPLRRLLARADRLEEGPRGYLAALAAWFDAPQPLPAGALTRQLAAGDAGDALWLCADPAWVEPDMSGARLLACGQMRLSPAEAEALAEPLAPLLEEQGMHLALTTPDRWHLRLPPGTAVPDFPAPEQALGENLLQHLPQGPEGRRWRILQNELQVALHQHPLNAQRRAAGKPPVNSLWLWGAGALPAKVRTGLQGVVSDDPLLRALAARAGIVHHPRPDGASGRAADTVPSPSTETWLLDLQDLPADVIADAWWPRIDGLARRDRLRLSFASGERCEHRPWHRWRFWRRPRA